MRMVRMSTDSPSLFPEWDREILEDYQLRQAKPKCKFEKVLTAVLRLHSFTVPEGSPNFVCCGCGETAPCRTTLVIFEKLKELRDVPEEVHRLEP
jgi:hypothetical protein